MSGDGFVTESARFCLRATVSVGIAAILFAATTGAQPRIDQAVPCAKRGSAGGLANGTGLIRVNVPVDRYPKAVCNDGSGAVFFVRKHLSSASTDSWNIDLQGGGGCEGGQSCAERWCSIDTNFGADKMSSTYAPARGIVGGGIHRRDPRNPLWDWNHVFLYYCSSDGWAGRADDRVLTATGPGGGSVQYRMPFHGADIVDAVIDMLRGGLGPVSYTDADGAAQVLPGLDDARRVLLSGASAGGGGVIYNADRLGGFLSEHNHGCPGANCVFDFRALIDSSVSPDLAHFGFEQTRFCLELGLCDASSLNTARWNNVMGDLRAAQATEDSCAGWHLEHAPATVAECADGEHIIANHLTVPFFVRQDLQDSLQSSNLIEARFTLDGKPIDATDYGRLLEQDLRRLPATTASGEEGGPRRSGAPLRPAVLGAQCTKHETIHSDEPYFDHLAPAADVSAYATADLLRNWLADEGPIEAIVPFREPGALASCGGSAANGIDLDVTWADFEGTVGLGQPVVEPSRSSALFTFFDRENWEILAKVLDGCAINGHLWVFTAATTNAGYQLRARDPRNGAERRYRNSLGASARAVTDTEAFPCVVDELGPGPSAGRPSSEDSVGAMPAATANCVDDASQLCLGGRFAVQVIWSVAGGGSGSGSVVPLRSADSGLFAFFELDNWELLVKVLDGCVLNQRFWVAAAASTNVEFVLRITDTVAGLTREYRNGQGSAAEAILDTDAFASCAL